MRTFKEKLFFKGKYLKVFKKGFLKNNKRKGEWEYIERKNAVIVFPLTKKKEVILEKIFRIPVNSFVIELPAGMLDKKKETPKEAAKRELLEETGYLAKKLIPITSTLLNPALEKTDLIVFFAPDVEYIGQRKTEDTEEIEVIKVPLRKLVDFLLNPPKGVKTEIKTLGILPILGKKGLI